MFQLLLHPMLDDRTKARTDLDALKVRVWTPKSNRYGWSSYLGDGVAGPDVSPVRGRSPAARFSPVFPRPGSAWAPTLSSTTKTSSTRAASETAVSPATSTSCPASPRLRPGVSQGRDLAGVLASAGASAEGRTVRPTGHHGRPTGPRPHRHRAGPGVPPAGALPLGDQRVGVNVPSDAPGHGRGGNGDRVAHVAGAPCPLSRVVWVGMRGTEP
jgi:hypothetical protein